MSNIFEYDDFEEPVYLDTGELENEHQQHLRERFDSLAERNRLEIACFNPKEIYGFKSLKFRTGDKEAEEAEPEVAGMLMHNMLRSVQLDAPTDENDPRYITDRSFNSGVRAVIFAITREDGSFVPVYCDTERDGETLKTLCLISFDRVHDTVLQYRDLSEYSTKLMQKLKVNDRTLRVFSATALKGFNATLDDIRRLQ